MHFLTYFGTQIITEDRLHHYISLPMDALWPFSPVRVFVYVITYLFWIAGAVMIMREDKDKCYELFSCIMLAEFVCLVFYVFYPTIMTRPEINGDGISEYVLGIIYIMDEPCNLFPSMHCMLSWMFFRLAQHCKYVNRPWVIFCGIMAVLICLSTQFIKQHVFADLVSGIFFGELSVFLGCKFNLSSVLFKKQLVIKCKE